MTRPIEVPCRRCAVGVPVSIASQTQGYCFACAAAIHAIHGSPRPDIKTHPDMMPLLATFRAVYGARG